MTVVSLLCFQDNFICFTNCGKEYTQMCPCLHVHRRALHGACTCIDFIVVLITSCNM